MSIILRIYWPYYTTLMQVLVRELPVHEAAAQGDQGNNTGESHLSQL